MTENMNQKIYGDYLNVMKLTMWSNVLTLKFINECFDKYCERYNIKVKLSNDYIETIEAINNKIKECKNKRKKLNEKIKIIDQKLNSKESYKNVVFSLLLLSSPISLIMLVALIYTFITHSMIGKLIMIISIVLFSLLLFLTYIYYYKNIYKYEKEKKRLNKQYINLYQKINNIYNNDLNDLTMMIYNKEIEPLIK